MTIAVMPGKFVTIFAVRRDKFVEDFGEIPLQPGFELNRPDHAGGPHVEDAMTPPRSPGGLDSSCRVSLGHAGGGPCGRNTTITIPMSEGDGGGARQSTTFKTGGVYSVRTENGGTMPRTPPPLPKRSGGHSAVNFGSASSERYYYNMTTNKS